MGGKYVSLKSLKWCHEDTLHLFEGEDAFGVYTRKIQRDNSKSTKCRDCRKLLQVCVEIKIILTLVAAGCKSLQCIFVFIYGLEPH